MRRSATLLAVLAVSTALPSGFASPPQETGAQEPAAKEAEPAAAANPRDQDLAELSLEDANAKLAAYRDASDAAADDAARLAALRGLASGRHARIADEFIKVSKGKDRALALEALRMLGTQRDPSVERYLSSLLRVGRNPDLERVAEAARALGYCGWGKSGFRVLNDLFWKCSDSGVRKAIVFAYGRQKEKQAFSVLVAMIDMPAPKDPNSPTNPPASYWEERGRQWEALRDDVNAAIESICGRKFYSAEAAQRWWNEDGRKQGFKLEKTADPWQG